MAPVVYRIDRDDHLCFFNAQWDRFALDNDGENLVETAVAGTPLLDHISDDTLRHLTAELIAKVRRDNGTVKLPMRCDSPELQRFMNLEIAAGENDEVEFTVELVEQRARSPVALLDASVARSSALLYVCSWCKRGLVEGAWKALDEVIRTAKAFEREPVPGVSHGLCPDCSVVLGKHF